MDARRLAMLVCGGALAAQGMRGGTRIEPGHDGFVRSTLRGHQREVKPDEKMPP